MTTRSQLYNSLKAVGWEPEKRFPHYTVAELEEIRAALEQSGTEVPLEQPKPKPQKQKKQKPAPPLASAPDPNELPGQRLNTDDDVIRVDEQGRQWYQEEVRKPAYPKPRGRRVLTYIDTGVRKETVHNGEYVETFEISGEAPGRPAEVKITLPSYQVGIYKDPRFPFRIHCYNGREGFNLFEVQKYYGGAELVPGMVKRIYIENDLCYDIRSVVQAIQSEYRQMMLQRGAR